MSPDPEGIPGQQGPSIGQQIDPNVVILAPVVNDPPGPKRLIGLFKRSHG